MSLVNDYRLSPLRFSVISYRVSGIRFSVIVPSYGLDYRKVNQHLSVDTHPLPKLDELVESAAGNSYYATLDMKDAYYQVMLDEASRDLTTFSEGVALYRFKRLPLGLSCSAAIFARQLAQVLSPLLKENWLRSYLDDIIIYAPTYNTLLQRLDKIWEEDRGITE